MWGLYSKWAINILLFNFSIEILLRKQSHNNLYVDRIIQIETLVFKMFMYLF